MQMSKSNTHRFREELFELRHPSVQVADISSNHDAIVFLTGGPLSNGRLANPLLFIKILEREQSRSRELSLIPLPEGVFSTPNAYHNRKECTLGSDDMSQYRETEKES